MSYDVTVNGKTTNVSSYDAAKATVKAGVADVANALRTPLRRGLVKSFKALNRINADRLRSADKLEAGQKSIRHALTADTMMSKYMIGDFEERISDLERKVEDLIKAK